MFCFIYLKYILQSSYSLSVRKKEVETFFEKKQIVASSFNVPIFNRALFLFTFSSGEINRFLVLNRITKLYFGPLPIY